jgi:hypothetical protein
MSLNYGHRRPVVHDDPCMIYEYGAPVMIVTWKTEEM